MDPVGSANGEARTSGQDWRGAAPHPLDRDLAALSRDAYADGPSGVPGWRALTAADLEHLALGGGLFDDPASGFQARLYVHAVHGHVLAMRGSDDARDWLTNLRQAFGGDDAQYRHAAMAASRVRAALDGDLVLTGHSLGGGLAALAALRAGVPAVTFNAAGVHDRTLALHGIPRDVRGYAAASGHVRHYTVENDLATALQMERWRTAPLLPDAIGHRIRLRDPDPLGPLAGLVPGASIRHGLDRHAIDAVVCALDLPEPVPPRPHPAARLLAQAMEGLHAMQEARPDMPLPLDRFVDLSVSIAARAWDAGLRRIDRLAGSDDGSLLFAIEGDPGDPAQRRVTVDVADGACERFDRGSASLRRAPPFNAALEHAFRSPTPAWSDPRSVSAPAAPPAPPTMPPEPPHALARHASVH